MKEGLYLDQVSFWTTSPLLMFWSDGDMTWCWHRPRCCLWLWSQFIHFQSLSDSPGLPLTGGGCGGRWPPETQTRPLLSLSVQSPVLTRTPRRTHHPCVLIPDPASVLCSYRHPAPVTGHLSEQTPSYLEDALPFNEMFIFYGKC